MKLSLRTGEAEVHEAINLPGGVVVVKVSEVVDLHPDVYYIVLDDV